MKVFHVLPQFHYINERTIIGGYPSAVARLAAAQAAQGLDVEIVSRMPKSAKNRFAGVELSNLEVIDATSHRHPLRFARKVSTFLRSRIKTGDVIHFHSGHAEYAIVSAAIASLSGISVVHTLYCPLLSGARGFLQKSAIALASARGVSFSGMSKNICNSIPVPSTWTPPVIDYEYLSPAPDNRTGCQLLFVGNATPSKGLADLLPAFIDLTASLKNNEGLRLVVTTELARTNERSELNDVLDKLGNSPALSRISWSSIVPDMRELLGNSDIHVAPFRTTNGPSDYFMSTLEAMAMGKVCVVSDLPGMAEVITDGENGFSFRTGDSADLERALLRAIDSDRDAIGERSRDFVVQTFGQSAVDSTNQLYGDRNA